MYVVHVGKKKFVIILKIYEKHGNCKNFFFLKYMYGNFPGHCLIKNWEMELCTSEKSIRWWDRHFSLSFISKKSR